MQLEARVGDLEGTRLPPHSQQAGTMRTLPWRRHRHATARPLPPRSSAACMPAWAHSLPPTPHHRPLLQLWHAYLTERLTAVRGLAPNHPNVEALNNTFERAMVSMHKMPVIWGLYLEFMLGQRWITRTRRLFDRALTSLPVTQHERIWPLYLRFIGLPGIPVETAVRVRGWLCS